MRRLLATIIVVTVGLALSVVPAGAQEEQPPLGAVTDGLRDALEGAQPLFDGLEPVTTPLGEGLAELVAELEPLLAALEEAVTALEPSCAALGPIIEGIDPIVQQLQPALDLLDPATTPAQLMFLSPLLAEVDSLTEQVLTLCAAQVEEPTPEPAPETTTTTTTTTTPPPTPVDPGVDQLPRTGPASSGTAAPIALGLLALAGLVEGARRRLSSS